MAVLSVLVRSQRRVVGAIIARIEGVDKRFADRCVSRLPCGDADIDPVGLRSAEEMDFRGQSTPGTTDGLIPFFSGGARRVLMSAHHGGIQKHDVQINALESLSRVRVSNLFSG